MKKKTRKKAAGYNSLLKSISGLAREAFTLPGGMMIVMELVKSRGRITREEVMAALKVSATTAWRVLDELEKKGLLTIHPSTPLRFNSFHYVSDTFQSLHKRFTEVRPFDWLCGEALEPLRARPWQAGVRGRPATGARSHEPNGSWRRAE